VIAVGVDAERDALVGHADLVDAVSRRVLQQRRILTVRGKRDGLF